MKNTGRTLALDHGDARIGMALSDPIGLFSQPLATLPNQGKKTLSDILSIAAANEVGTIVLGIPYELDGSIGPQAQTVEVFAKKLEQKIDSSGLDIRLHFWDERLTSVSAERIIAGSKLKGAARHGAVDRVSASLILESYLMSRPQSLS